MAVRNDQTGALTPVAGSPFTAVNQALTIDVQGRFLFAIGSHSIRMFQITDSTTVAYHEVANSPFASPNTNQPAFIAVEPTGQYIAVVDRVGQNPGEALVETFQISPAAVGGPALIPVAGSATELDSTPVGVAQPPDNKEFLIFMGPNPQSLDPTISQGSEFQALSIDPLSGFITGLQANAALPARGDSFAMDPQGRYYVTGTQNNLLEFGVVQLVGLGGDGLLGNIQLPQFNYPASLWIDSTGTFLYVATSNLQNPVVVNIYSVNLQTGQLTPTLSSPLPGFASVPPYSPDPTGSFDYGFGADQNTAIASTVDPQTGHVQVTEVKTTASATATSPKMSSTKDQGVQMSDTWLSNHLADLFGADEFAVNSLHAQAIDRLAPGLRIEARAPDGTIEAVSMPSAKGFLLAVQWHPEWRWLENAQSRTLFEAFGKAVGAHRGARNPKEPAA